MVPIESAFLSGATLYAIIHNPNGQVWNNNTLAFENFNGANWANYAVAMAEQAGSGYYRAAYPAQITGVLTTEVVYQQKGGAPALSDAPAIAAPFQSQGGNVAAVLGSQPAASNLSAALANEVAGHAVTGTLSTTQATTSLTQALVNAYAGRSILWTSGALAGLVAGITAYAPAGGLLTFTTLPAAPSNGDTFLII